MAKTETLTIENCQASEGQQWRVCAFGQDIEGKGPYQQFRGTPRPLKSAQRILRKCYKQRPEAVFWIEADAV